MQNLCADTYVLFSQAQSHISTVVYMYHKQRKFGVAKVLVNSIISLNFVHPKPNLALCTFADILDKFANLYAAKFISKQFGQTLATPNFHCLWYVQCICIYIRTYIFTCTCIDLQNPGTIPQELKSK